MSCDPALPSSCAPPPPPPPHNIPTIFIFHDSNVKGLSAEEIAPIIKNINKNNTQHTISPQQTFTLSQTYNRIKTLSFKNTDTVILATLTNDARQTKQRQSRSPSQTIHMQSQIITHLKAFIPASHIVILEAPPLLTSPNSDIFPFNDGSFRVARQHGARFSRSLIGEQHLFKDGFHIQHRARHLLLKSLAAAAANVDPHLHFGLRRPPFGNFGPWEAPNGQGILPRPLTYRGVAVAQPLNFRRAHIRPLMDMNIRR